jgi:hypothetical protein
VRLFDSTDGLVIKGLREQVVTCPEDVFALLTAGEGRRQVGATHLNQHSSRSHVIVRIWMESKSCSSKAVRVSSLSLVDLAGSESVRLTGSNERREEGHYINKSLMTLGQVVYALSDPEKKHVPYRDSKLTRLLQPSLSGNAQVVLLCCISPLAGHLEESHNTFKFAIRAKKIPQKAVITETADDKTLLQGYKEEIDDLKQQLLDARDAQQKYMALMNQKQQQPVVDDDDIVTEGEITELVEAIQTMEKLILKSNPSPVRPEDLLDLTEDGASDSYDEENLLALVSAARQTTAEPILATPPRPMQQHDQDLQNGLSRVQGLLGSVLKRRKASGDQTKSQTEQEIAKLRQDLKDQQVATSLRKADASFLQSQLAEKDALLKEVGKILEAIEERQAKLEAENNQLRGELILLKQHAQLKNQHAQLNSVSTNHTKASSSELL